jgi:PHO85 cyclin-5
MGRDSDALAFINNLSTNGPYSASLASSASSSQTSVWSDTSSQLSDDTSISTTSNDSTEACDSYFASERTKSRKLWDRQSQQTHVEAQVPRELRQNPRRSTNSAVHRSGCPPVLTRQSDRKVNFVDNLVGKP